MGIYDGIHAKSVTKTDTISQSHTRWDADNKRINNLANPVVGSDAVTLDYIDNKCLNKTTGGSLLGSINMNGNDLFGLQNPPQFNTSAVSKEYVDNNRVITSGGNLRYDIDMGAHLIYRPTIPVMDSEITNKRYVDTQY